MLPLSGRNRVLGTLGLVRAEHTPYSKDEIDFLTRVSSQIALAVENALAYREISELKDKLAQEKLYLEEEIRIDRRTDDVIGDGPVLREVLRQVEVVAPTDSAVLVTGETGTGKELIARAVHRHSIRRDRTFVKLNCAAIPTGLLESELFGHEKGAFTGAVERRTGRFELADGGTLFLDEVGEIDLAMQVKILRVLEERAFERVGGSKTINVDVRLIAASNRDLKKLVKEGKFREDLFYRLSVVGVDLPPLRERRDDIPLLISTFVRECSADNGKPVREITQEAVNVLMSYDWPGNVRELRNTIEQMVVLARGERLTLRDVPAAIRTGADLTKISVVRPGVTMTVEEAERQLIIQALKECDGNRTRAASRIGMSRRTLHRKLKRYGLEDL
jgi:formate hydrogenlyase transcriptional activator